MKIRSYRNLISKFKKGFSLVELLVSISIFLVFVIAVTEVTTSVSKESRNSANKQRAAVLAEEAVEAVRNIRDANFDNLVDGVHGLATTSNEWSLAGSSDLTDIFTRAITISTVNPNQKKVDVLITWADQIEPNNSFSLSTYLTNWRAILNVQVGLTVNKSVINHGGSKVAADFGPFLVGTTTVTLGSATLFNEGVYTVSESTDPNYTQTFSGDCNSGGVVNLVADTINTCLITNEEKPSMLTVTKNVINHGLSKVASDFTLKVDTNPVVSGATNIFNSGVHTVSETPDSAYNLTISGDCDSGGLVTLFPNTTKSCILTNEEKLSSIVVNKTVINHGGSKVASNFAPYKVDATTVTLGATTTFDSGTYTVSETVDPAYTASFSGDCGPGGSVTLTAGSTKVCNITNEENLVVPTVTTPTVASITNTTATLGANVTSLGVPNSISARGTCWGTSPSPSTNCLAEGGVGTGVFTQARTGFTAGTPYYYRGYAVNTTGTGYSPDGTFTTTASCSVASSVVGTPTLYDSAASVTATVNKPAGVVQGDIMFAYILHNNAVDRLTTIPSGWLPVGSRRKNASVNQALYYKVAGASEGASYAFGFSASSKIGVTISAYRGCFNISNPIETFSDSIYVVSNTTYRAGSVTLSAGSTVLMFPSMYTTAVRTFANPLTQGGGWTEDYDQGSTASDFSRAAYRKFIPTLGATGDIDSIGTSGGTVKHAYGVVLRPL